MTLNGKWADGTPLLAIPNYARNNRSGTAASDEAAAGNPAIDYSGASGGASAAGGAKPNAPARRGSSMVWIKDQ
jgi:hypothetical protein